MSYMIVNDVDLYVFTLANCVSYVCSDFAAKCAMGLLLNECPRHRSNIAVDAFLN